MAFCDEYMGGGMLGSGLGPLADSESQHLGFGGHGGVMNEDHMMSPHSLHHHVTPTMTTVTTNHAEADRNHTDAQSSQLLSGLVSQAERVITVTQRLKNTTTCIFIYILLMILNLFVMAWELSGRGFNPVIITLECLINLFIIGEVSIGIYGLGRSYFHSLSNIVDCTLSGLCVIFFIVLLATHSQEDADYMSALDAVFLVVRFLFQLLRLSVLAYRSRKVALMQTQERVDFNAVNVEECVEDEVIMASVTTSTQQHGMMDGHTMNGRSGSFSGIQLLPAFLASSSSLDNGPQRTRTLRPSASSSSSSTMSTTNIHLKPSVYLELQNARAFAMDTNVHPITVHANGHDATQHQTSATSSTYSSSSFSSSSSTNSPPSPSKSTITTDHFRTNGSIHEAVKSDVSGESSLSLSANGLSTGHASSRSPNVPVPALTPPPTQHVIDADSSASSPASVAAITPSNVTPATAHDPSMNSTQNPSSSGAATDSTTASIRSLHSLLANDYDDEEDLEML